MKSPVVSVLNLFENKKRYIVPMFQRQYVWNLDRQWTPLWEDIERKAVEMLRWNERRAIFAGDELKQLEERPPSEHFLGAIVLDQHRTFGMEVPANVLVDGQQ